MTDPVERDNADHAEEQDRQEAVNEEKKLLDHEAFDALRNGDGYGGIDVSEVYEAIQDNDEIGEMIFRCWVKEDWGEMEAYSKGILNELISDRIGFDQEAA